SFVTGGSGFVGGAVIRHLVGSGIDVRGLARSDEAVAAVIESGGSPIRGDLSDHGALRSGMSGCDVVYHVAGVNTMCPADPGTMYRVNVDLVRAVVHAATDTDVRRIVLTSSAAAIGEPAGVVADERSPHAGRFLSHYARSKYLGERAFFDEAERRGIEAVAVNPSSVQGPGRSDGSALLLRYALGMRRPIVVDAMLSIVDIDDTAQAHLAAAIRGRPGRRYLISGAAIGIREAVALLAAAADRPIDPIVLRSWIGEAAYPIAAAAGLFGGDAPVCVEMLRTLLHGHRFDTSLSVSELGMAYTPLGDTFARTVDWLADEGLIHR
ncbi:MAG: NAD-dependent epimerase/dehydratase family protein, partial [Actinomycetota bacterium]|nr:NAD-dependent epimerase/dehydratase family protein [Actinomycetota bacterium]